MDRMVRGFIIGIATGAVKDILSFISYSLHFSTATYGHLMSVYIYGKSARTTLELVFSQLVELGIGGAVGVAFIYYAYRTKNKKNLWFKGIIFAYGVYFLTYMFGTFFRLPLVGTPALKTSISNFITTAIFGILMGWVNYVWAKKIGDFSEEKESQPNKVVYTASEEEIKDEHEEIKLKKPIKLK